MMNELPDFDKTRIDDVMVGNAMPEAEKDLMWTFNFINGIKN
jgi:acetyl-CoA acyltransferase